MMAKVTNKEKIKFLDDVIDSMKFDLESSDISVKYVFSLCFTAERVNPRIYKKWFKKKMRKDALKFDFWIVPKKGTKVEPKNTFNWKGYFFWDPEDYNSRVTYLFNLKSKILVKELKDQNNG